MSLVCQFVSRVIKRPELSRAWCRLIALNSNKILDIKVKEQFFVVGKLPNISNMEENQAVTNFREYLRIKSIQPNPDYDGIVKFLKKSAAELELPCRIYEPVPKKPIIIITWEGTDPSLPSVLLNSHTDVVPVFEDHWTYDPFSAHKDEHGNIFARGSQDMKCVSIQYIEALRRLKNDGKRLLRTVHMSFVPDEEIGGIDGMKTFVETDDFKKLNIGVALDEGVAVQTDHFLVFYGERIGMRHGLKFICRGKPGHGSMFVQDNAGEKLRKVINSVLTFRDQEEKRLKDNPDLNLGDVTTVNLTKLEGGVQLNVVPAELIVYFDARVAPSLGKEEFVKLVKKWCEDAGEGVTCDHMQENEQEKLTSISKDDPWWNAFSTAIESMNLKVTPMIFPAATDSRYLRRKGYPAYGFSPMNNTPVLLHDHNEYLNEDIFLKGIDIYCGIIPAMANRIG